MRMSSDSRAAALRSRLFQQITAATPDIPPALPVAGWMAACRRWQSLPRTSCEILPAEIAIPRGREREKLADAGAIAPQLLQSPATKASPPHVSRDQPLGLQQRISGGNRSTVQSKLASQFAGCGQSGRPSAEPRNQSNP